MCIRDRDSDVEGGRIENSILAIASSPNNNGDVTDVSDNGIDTDDNTIDESMDFITGREDKNDTTGWFYHSSRFLPGAHSVTRFFEVTEGDIQLARRGG